MRLQLPRLFGRDREQGRAASQSLRPRRQGNRPDAEGAERGTGKGAGGVIRPGGSRACRGSARRHGGARPFARQSGRGHLPVAPAAQQGRIGKGNLAHRFRSLRRRPRLCRRRLLRHLRPQRSRPCRPDHCLAGRLAHHQGARQDAARSADRRRLAGAGAGQPVRTDFLHHRRRAAREGAGAGAGRGSRRRCRDARRDGGAAEIFRRASASRSLRRGAGAAAAAALFDLVVAQCDARKTVADGRLRALRDRQAQAHRAWRRHSSPSASIPATSSRSMCRRPTASRCRRIRRCRSS